MILSSRLPWEYKGSLCTCGPTEPNPDCICMRGVVDKVGYAFHREYVEINRGGTLE